MQKNPDEGDASPRQPATPASGGVHQDPDRVAIETPIWTIEAPGWSSPPAYASTISFSKYTAPFKDGVLSWNELRINELHLSPPAALLLLQGMSPADLFPPDALIVRGGVSVNGPFMYVRGQYAPFTPKILNVVLASPKTIPEGATREEVLGLLVEHVLGSS